MLQCTFDIIFYCRVSHRVPDNIRLYRRSINNWRKRPIRKKALEVSLRKFVEILWVSVNILTSLIQSRREGFTNGFSSAPAPTTYNISSKFGNNYHDFNRAKYSSMFQKPIAERPLSSKTSLPAPNQYDVDYSYRFFKRNLFSIVHCRLHED